MAARKIPSAGGKPDKIIRDALMIAVRRECKGEDGKNTTYLNRIIAKVVDLAVGGDQQAYKEIFDRLDGKSNQGIAIEAEITHNYVARIPALSQDMETWSQEHAAALMLPSPIQQ